MKKFLLFFALIASFAASAQQQCVAPTGLYAVTRDSVAVLNWSSTATAGTTVTYRVEWKRSSDSTWRGETVQRPGITLPSLRTCTEYVFRVKTNCSSTISSAFSTETRFRTTGCVAPCITPSSVRAIAGNNTVTAIWLATSARAYEVQYRLSDATAWSASRVVTSPSTVFEGLTSCRTYQVRVRSVCGGANTGTVVYSDWSATATVSTSGCNTAPCTVPLRLSFSTTTSAAVLRWDTVRGGVYELQWARATDSVLTWRTVTNARSGVSVTGLSSCQVYIFRVRAVCGANSYSAWSYPMRFQTLGCQTLCVTPTGLRSTFNDTAAIVSWAAVRNVTSYNVQYRAVNTTTWQTVTVATNVATIGGLARCTAYEVRVQSVCGANSASAYVTTVFTTRCATACNAPVVTVRSVDSLNMVVLSWTGSSQLYLVQTRLASDSLNWRTDTVRGNVLTLGNLLSCRAYVYRIYGTCPNGLGVWSDLGRFETGGCATNTCTAPTVISTSIVDTVVTFFWNTTSSNPAYNIQYRVVENDSLFGNWITVSGVRPQHTILLRRCRVYEWRVQMQCNGTLSGWSVINRFTTGGCNTGGTCTAPTGLTQTVSDSSVILYWNGSITTNATYNLQYRTVVDSTFGAWVTINNVRPQYFTILQRCKVYQWRVQQVCTGTVSDWSAINRLETGGCNTGNVCAAVTQIMANDTTGITYLVWNGGTGTGAYVVEYRPLRDTMTASWITMTTSNSWTVIQSIPCTYYQVRIRRVCSATLSSEWATYTFRTAGVNCFDDGGAVELEANTFGSNMPTISDFGVFPNPGSEMLQVAYKIDNTADVNIELLNLQGQVVRAYKGGNQEAGNYIQTLDDLSSINEGMYLVVLRTNGKVMKSQKWIKK